MSKGKFYAGDFRLGYCAFVNIGMIRPIRPSSHCPEIGGSSIEKKRLAV